MPVKAIKLKPRGLTQEYANENGILEGWYVTKMKIDSSLAGLPYYLDVISFFSAIEVFCDGKQVHSFGVFGTERDNFKKLNTFRDPRFVKLDLQIDSVYELAIHFKILLPKKPIANFVLPNQLFILSAITTTTSRARWFVMERPQVFFAGLSIGVTFLISILFLILWRYNRNEIVFYYLAMFNASIFLVALLSIGSFLNISLALDATLSLITEFLWYPIIYFGIGTLVTISKKYAGWNVGFIKWLFGFFIFLELFNGLIWDLPILKTIITYTTMIIVGIFSLLTFGSVRNRSEKAIHFGFLGFIAIILLLSFFQRYLTNYSSVEMSIILFIICSIFPLSLIFYLALRLKEILDEKQIHEFNQLKSNLYTNVTHEFRSPLTVILGITDQIKKYVQSNDQMKLDQGLGLIRRNGKRLLELVNQLLTLNKMQTGDWPIQNTHGNIVYFLNYLIESFESMAEEKEVQIFVDQPEKAILMDYDPDLIEKIVSNMLSNAIKFSPEGGKVRIQIRQVQDELIFGIHNDGKGIPAAKVDTIFNRFGQLEEDSGQGTGIGLALTKEIVERLDGKIEVESGANSGVQFTILLPIVQLLELSASSKEILPNVSGEDDILKSDDQPLVLVVEDNLEVAYYIGECLEENYHIVYARDGQKGLEKAQELIPDFIISDVMMPILDGLEMTRILKNDLRTSHIPLILLTAKVGEEAKLEGLQTGADAYLTKPFDQRELMIRMERLIHLRKQLIEQFKRVDNLKFDPPRGKENQFLIEFKEIIERDMTQNFSVQELCKLIGLSRTQLHRKLKALTDQSTSQYVRSIRLNKAKELLKTTDRTIAEIAYDVGFQSPSYFSRMFSQTWMQSPSEWREQNL